MKRLDKIELKQILLKQYELYPKIQLQDFVKLIFQNEFAGGHMIGDKETSLIRLETEILSLKNDCHNMGNTRQVEKIGNGLCRLNLHGMQDSQIDLKTVNNLFVETANSVKGNVKLFEQKLEVLRECIINGKLPHAKEGLDKYIQKYRNIGYPPVSHSKIYKENYLPAYRIVKEKYCHYLEVFKNIDALMRKHSCVNVAIDGGAGAGKSTLAMWLSKVYDCNIFHMDDFFLRPEQRTQERLGEVGGNVDYTRFKQEVIRGIQGGYEFEYRPYNCENMELEAPIAVKPKQLNIIEGVYSMHPTLIDAYQLKIFLEIDKTKQANRILKRNGPNMQKRFLKEWIPLENQYFDKFNIKTKSDVVILCYN